MRNLKKVVEKGQISGNGAFTRRCEEMLQQLLGGSRTLLTTSCTDALEMAGVLLDIGPDDEVIVPSFTFVSTVNAFVMRGATPVFCDVRPDTLNLDERHIEQLITERTKAIVPVHYAGVGCEMESILRVANQCGASVVEDNAQGLFGEYGDKPLGTFGCMATLSFHATKNVSCGEGGALVVNDPRYVERAEIIREKGTDRARFERGEVAKYTWVDLGSSHVPSDLLAAFLLAQLEKRDEIQSRRQKVWEFYQRDLRDWAEQHEVGLPFVPSDCRQSYHMFYLLMPSQEQRDGLIKHLGDHDILAVFHYIPLHLSEMAKRCGAGGEDCPITEDISRRLVRLPFYTGLSRKDQERVIEAVVGFPG